MLFIFDWDGTICDSTTKIISSMQAAAAELSLDPLPGEAVMDIIGLSLMNAAEVLYPQAELELRRSLCEAYSRHYLLSEHIPAGLFPYVRETLSALRDRGHFLAVATGKSRRGLDRVLRALELEDFFHASRCADETESKPSPLMLFELLEELNMSPAQTVMVGDTEFDMDMARQARVRRIGVSYGAHAADRLHQYELEACVDCFSEILHWEAINQDGIQEGPVDARLH